MISKSPQREQHLVEFIHETEFSDLPGTVVEQARRCFIDLTACSLAGLGAESAEITRDFVLSFGGSEEASLFGARCRVPLPLAVLANTTACEALDCDDGFNSIKGHPGACVFPAMLAFAELNGMTGASALAALVVGYEVAIRAGLAVHAHYSDYHGSGSWGGLGTAAVAARCLGLNREQTLHALGAAEYHGAMVPIMRCVGSPEMVKDGVGWGAFSGVSAALMAARGFSSTPCLLTLDSRQSTPPFGSDYLIEKVYFKPYCCCRWAQPAVRATLDLTKLHSIKPDEIQRVEVETFAEACRLSRKVPANTEEAQYSLAFPVAAAIVHGDVGPAEVLGEGLSDTRIADLMDRITIRERSEFQEVFPHERLAEVIITSEHGRYSSGVVTAQHEADEPISDEGLKSKFRLYAGHTLPINDVEELLATLDQIDRLGNCQAIVAALSSVGESRNAPKRPSRL